MGLKINDCIVHSGQVPGPSVHPIQNPGNAVEVAIIAEPVITDHIGHHPLNPFRQNGIVLFQQVIELFYENLQGRRRIICPVLRQEMIVINIDYHPAVMTVFFVQLFAAHLRYWMAVGKTVYVAVEQDPFLYPDGKVLILVSPDAVCNKIAKRDFPVPERKIDMRQIIHVDQGIPIPKIIIRRIGFMAVLYICKNFLTPMTLIKSISGIRGTIGGRTNDNLTPVDAVKFAAAYGTWLKGYADKQDLKVVIGRDARISGEMIQQLVTATLVGLGIDIIDLGLSTTPTVELAVPLERADGGIILTASHNPKQWNALKLLNEAGEFLDAEQGAVILDLAEREDFEFAKVDDLGTVTSNDAYFDIHVEEVLNLDLVNASAIRAAGLKVVVDAVNSSGGIAIPKLLEALGVTVIKLYCEPTGDFPHNPEPLKEHLGEICKRVVAEKADLGIVVDPDVDRLAFISDTGEIFGEEYTLVACADYVLGKTRGDTVSNLSSSRALRDVTEKHGGKYHAAAVGEVNVVRKMKDTKAVIGGEGNGGVIYPDSHYGRDALVGTALFLMLLAERGGTVQDLRDSYPSYYMSKKKMELTPDLNVDELLSSMADNYADQNISTIDGVKIDFPEYWVHLRKSNTEPIIRIYTEAGSQAMADKVADRFITEIRELVAH